MSEVTEVEELQAENAELRADRDAALAEAESYRDTYEKLRRDFDAVNKCCPRTDGRRCDVHRVRS